MKALILSAILLPAILIQGCGEHSEAASDDTSQVGTHPSQSDEKNILSNSANSDGQDILREEHLDRSETEALAKIINANRDLAGIYLNLILESDDPTIHEFFLEKAQERDGDNLVKRLVVDEISSLKKAFPELPGFLQAEYVKAGLFSSVHPREIVDLKYLLKNTNDSNEFITSLVEELPSTLRNSPFFENVNLQTVLAINNQSTELQLYLDKTSKTPARCAVLSSIVMNAEDSLLVLLESGYEHVWNDVIDCPFIPAGENLSDLEVAEIYGASQEVFTLLISSIRNKPPQIQTLEAQQQLNLFGFELVPDGIYGPNTQKALLQAQIELGTTPHGFPTREILLSLKSKSKAQKDLLWNIQQISDLNRKEGEYKDLEFKSRLYKLKLHRKMVQKIVEKNPSLLSLTDLSGRTPLMHTISARDSTLAYDLIETGKSLDKVSSEGFSALAIAAYEKLYPVIYKLLTKGARFENNYGKAESVLFANGKVIDPIKKRVIDANRLTDGTYRSPSSYWLFIMSKLKDNPSQKIERMDYLSNSYDEGYIIDDVIFDSSINDFRLIFSRPDSFWPQTWLYGFNAKSLVASWDGNTKDSGFNHIHAVQSSFSKINDGKIFMTMEAIRGQKRSILSAGSYDEFNRDIKKCSQEKGQVTSLTFDFDGDFLLVCSFTPGLKTELKRYDSIGDIASSFGNKEYKYKDIIDIARIKLSGRTSYYVIYALGMEYRDQVAFVGTYIFDSRIQEMKNKGYSITSFVQGD